MLVDAATAEQDPPLVLTMAAVDRLSRLLAEADAAAALVRIEAYTGETQPAFAFSLEDQAGVDDTVLDYARVRVLLDDDTQRMLCGFELDYRTDDAGERFIVRRSG
jgi:Fe-S cluster assembly iron-binding protein IscA